MKKYFLAVIIIGFSFQASYTMKNNDLAAFIESKLSTNFDYCQDKNLRQTILQVCLNAANDAEVTRLMLLPDNKLAICLSNGKVKIFLLKTHDWAAVFSHSAPIVAMFYSDGKLRVDSQDGAYREWNLRTGDLLRERRFNGIDDIETDWIPDTMYEEMKALGFTNWYE